MRGKNAIIENLTEKLLSPQSSATIRGIRQSYLRTAFLLEAEVPVSSLRTRALELLLESHLMAIHTVRQLGRRNVKKEEKRAVSDYERKALDRERSEDGQ